MTDQNTENKTAQDIPSTIGESMDIEYWTLLLESRIIQNQ